LPEVNGRGGKFTESEQDFDAFSNPKLGLEWPRESKNETLKAETMKLSPVVPLLLMSSVLAFGQNAKKAVTSKIAIPSCPAGKGCTSFKQLWAAKDAEVRGADFACFETKFNDKSDTQDAFSLLNLGYYFRYAQYKDGVFANYDSAPNAKFAFPDWKVVDVEWSGGDDKSLEAGKQDTQLFFTRKYKNPAGDEVQQHFTMQLSTGRYRETYIIGTEQLEAAGECISLSASARRSRLRQ
jgi:hypothetical protein